MEMTKNGTRQFATFYLEDRMYGIDVMQVQEITKYLPVTQVALAPGYVKGLINLRGQISTAIGLRELFGVQAYGHPAPLVESDADDEQEMAVVCRVNGELMSLLVDRIGDVIEVDESDFEMTPDVVPHSVRRFMSGVYKTESAVLSVIDVHDISRELNVGEKKG
ncbi:MAG: chemotaxis protein CheW [Bdellovibrionales bacterium]|jgi:purine-binding chemotaxis protein CheW|nr:chemotaxis protein CheW [Bdellovibrionales bacterium]